MGELHRIKPQGDPRLAPEYSVGAQIIDIKDFLEPPKANIPAIIETKGPITDSTPESSSYVTSLAVAKLLLNEGLERDLAHGGATPKDMEVIDKLDERRAEISQLLPTNIYDLVIDSVWKK